MYEVLETDNEYLYVKSDIGTAFLSNDNGFTDSSECFTKHRCPVLLPKGINPDLG